MGNLFAEIRNNIVVNTIIADYEFAKLYSEQNNCDVVEFQENSQDDTLVARIGEIYIDGKFVSVNQAVELGLLTKEDAIQYGYIDYSIINN